MTIWIAILVAIIATTLMNIGLAFQKKQASEMPKIDEERKEAAQAFVRNRAWQAGVVGMLVGFGMYAWVAGKAPISIIQPTLGMGLVVLAFFSVFYLHERLVPIEWIAVVSMIVGLVLLGLSAADEGSAGEVNTVILVIITAVILVIVGLAYIARRWLKTKRVSLEWLLGVITGLFIGLGALFLKATWNAGDAGNDLLSLGVFLPATIVFFVGGIVIMQSGFQHGTAMIVVALESVVNKLVAIIGAMISLGEYLPEDLSLALMRVVAFIFLLGGTAALARFGKKEAG
ncbi:MAG: DMT family transporter [Thermodesulfobacteriota bacterium]|nr:DMT family transporter [Thermodesulfobacteriota bacterium]